MDADTARGMARIRARDAAPVWGLSPLALTRLCCRGDVPQAVKKGKHWYVTPKGMDLFFARGNR